MSSPSTTSQKIIDNLLLGNKRYLNNAPQNTKVTSEQRSFLAENGQKPSCAILTCSDARLDVEKTFDQPFGTLFISRSPGNTAFQESIASFEFAILSFQVPLLIVMGHSQCGAIAGATTPQKNNTPTSSLEELVNTIRQNLTPYLPKKEALTQEDKNTLGQQNVKLTIQKIIQSSDLIAKKVENQELEILGAFYNITSGEVQVLP